MHETVNFGYVEVLPDAEICKDRFVFMETGKGLLKATDRIGSMRSELG